MTPGIFQEKGAPLTVGVESFEWPGLWFIDKARLLGCVSRPKNTFELFRTARLRAASVHGSLGLEQRQEEKRQQNGRGHLQFSLEDPKKLPQDRGSKRRQPTKH